MKELSEVEIECIETLDPVALANCLLGVFDYWINGEDLTQPDIRKIRDALQDALNHVEGCITPDEVLARMKQRRAEA
jgi:hypothetical protein